MIRVVIADDEALVRGGLRMILESQADIEVAAEADDGMAALELVRRDPPDVVLMDIRMPGLDGIEATRRLVALGSGAPRVVILTTFDLDGYVYEAMKAGASGFLLKSARPQELLAGVCAAVAGTRCSPHDHAAPRRGLRPPAAARDYHAAAAGGADAARGGGAPAHRRRAVERGDRARALRVRGHREDTREPDLHEARPPRPHASSDPCLRERTRRTGGIHAPVTLR